MSFISRDLLGSYSEIENGNQYALKVICMLANYVFMIPMRTQTTKDVTYAYLRLVYATFGGSQYILSHWDGEFSSKQFTWLAEELGFTKVYTSPYTLMANLVLKRTHSFLKGSLQEIISNHNTDWDSIAHIVAIA